MDYWGGGLPGSRMCDCGVLSTCSDPTKWCNCDTEIHNMWQVDAGRFNTSKFIYIAKINSQHYYYNEEQL